MRKRQQIENEMTTVLIITDKIKDDTQINNVLNEIICSLEHFVVQTGLYRKLSSCLMCKRKIFCPYNSKRTKVKQKVIINETRAVQIINEKRMGFLSYMNSN